MSMPRRDEQAPTERFSSRASDYVKFRPSYPAPAIDYVLDGLGPPSEIVCADIGAGTGISSRLIADRGVRVIAIEPNKAMRESAEAHKLVEFRDGTAERTGLANASVQLVVCAQAFHWFDQAKALAEFHRVLVPSGRIALVWNDRDNADALTRSYNDAVLLASQDHPTARPFGVPEAFMSSRLFVNHRSASWASSAGRRALRTCPRAGRATTSWCVT
jgi:SAM-dependent methyltransferase